MKLKLFALLLALSLLAWAQGPQSQVPNSTPVPNSSSAEMKGCCHHGADVKEGCCHHAEAEGKEQVACCGDKCMAENGKSCCEGKNMKARAKQCKKAECCQEAKGCCGSNEKTAAKCCGANKCERPQQAGN